MSPRQEDFMKLGFGLFLHFNMATYVDKEWASIVSEGKPDLHGMPPEAAGDYVGFPNPHE